MLTERQQQVLALVAQGKRNEQIASELGLTKGTVQGYIQHIKMRLRLENRVQLALYWTEQQRATA